MSVTYIATNDTAKAAVLSLHDRLRLGPSCPEPGAVESAGPEPTGVSTVPEQLPAPPRVK